MHRSECAQFAPGIGRRLDGCAERDLDVEKIIALARDIVEYLKSL